MIDPHDGRVVSQHPQRWKLWNHKEEAMYSITAKLDLPATLGEGSATQASMPEIVREHIALHESVEALGDMISALQERLRPVLLSQPQGVAGGAGVKEQECHSELGKNLSLAKLNIRSSVERLREMLNSLAV